MDKTGENTYFRCISPDEGCIFAAPEVKSILGLSTCVKVDGTPVGPCTERETCLGGLLLQGEVVEFSAGGDRYGIYPTN